ncbi:MAG: pyridoxal phosphate-dependent aminotransferase [Pelagimonas sp.]|jgi:arginine:pyruvate transaminase|nr:pyridoxal phosphate-dependent aminotransferase [Pelagimonas sp.]
MAQISSRILNLNGGGSDGWEVFLKAREMVARGVDVTELTIGEHDIRTHSDILDAMHKSAIAGHTGYAMVPGVDRLRQIVADRVTRQTGVPTRPENVMITPGGQAGLFAAHMAALAPGDTALYVDPYYATYPGTLRAASAIPVSIPTRARDAFLPSHETIRAAAQTHNAKSLLINSPNNPTGMVYPKETLQEIAQACQDHDMWLISDEVYDTQIWAGEHISPRALAGMQERTIVIGSMSKSFAMTGSRIGWIVAPEPLIEGLIALATSTTYGVPGFIQDAAVFALENAERLEPEIAAPFQRRRDLALSVLAEQDTIQAVPPSGAMYLMLNIRATGLSGRAFAEALLETHKIAVMPGESFGDSAAGHLRVALTVADDRLADALRTICSFAKALADQHAVA